MTTLLFGSAPLISFYEWTEAIENAIGTAMSGHSKGESGVPPYDVYMTDDMCVFEIAVAGYDKNHLDVAVDDNKFTVTAKRIDSLRGDDNTVMNSKINRRGFKFTRVDARRKYDLSKMKAKLKDGILKLEIPFAESEKEKRFKVNIE